MDRIGFTGALGMGEVGGGGGGGRGGNEMRVVRRQW